MRVAAIQHDIVWEDPKATCARLESQIAAAAAGGVRLVVLTEMFATGFSMQTHKTAESMDGPIATWLHDQAVKHDAWVAGSVALHDPDGGLPTNSLLVTGSDGTVHRYDKIRPFSYAGEHERFRAGACDVVANIDGFRWGLTVCYDLRFADQYWRMAPDVDGYLVVANWPAARRAHWQSLLQARAIENQAFVVGVNRVGSGGNLDYAGDSRIIDPMGEILAGGAQAETVLVGDLDPAAVSDARARLPFMPDR